MTTTPIAQMVAAMLAGGVPHAAIVLAVETAELCLTIPRNSAENSMESAEEKRRRKDRERKQLKTVSAEIPRNSTDSAEIPVSTIYIKEDLKKERNSRGRKIPQDWKPSESHFLEGERLGFERAKVEAFGCDMRLWAEANENRAVARKADWDKTFLGWLRRQKPGEAPPPKARSDPEPTAEQLARRRQLIEEGERILNGQGRVAGNAEENSGSGPAGVVAEGDGSWPEIR